ncbi:3-keto-5-aminohexanoate cleavage protein [Streptomyces sp. NBC_00069]|uniref:3-keto-5-aminohexanoate cleavage protein n=1 Tax=Streptomyces sp. NBC_00069 TaxID=2975639 RepID=UPI003253ADB1|nr:3-keto-5-aminohexanoate cleavage protein [Streptomyces sp. NBC_00998]
MSVSLNGGRTAADGGAVPLSPPDVVESALGAVAAGAGEVLVHPRTPCGRESLSPRVVGPLLEAVRGAGVSVPLSVSAGIGAEPDPAGRLERVRSWTVLPDRAVVHFAEPGAEELAEALLARGVAVDAVVPLGGEGAGPGAVPRAEPGAVEPEPGALARFLAWPVRDPARIRLAVELAVADPALVAGLRWLPPVPLLLFGREAAAWPVLRLAARCGAGARIGAGDVLHLPDGRAARSNAELVSAALEVVGTQSAVTAWSR